MKASFNSTLDQMSDGAGPATAGGNLQHTAMKRDEDIPDEINNHEHTNSPGKGSNHFRGKSSYKNSEPGDFKVTSRSEILTEVTISYTDWYSTSPLRFLPPHCSPSQNQDAQSTQGPLLNIPHRYRHAAKPS
jgi:hypothetical protein